MTRRVVVTGMAGLTCIGLDWTAIRTSLLADHSGVRNVPNSLN